MYKEYYVCKTSVFELFFRCWLKTVLEKQHKDADSVKGSPVSHIELKLSDIYKIQFKYTSILCTSMHIYIERQIDIDIDTDIEIYIYTYIYIKYIYIHLYVTFKRCFYVIFQNLDALHIACVLICIYIYIYIYIYNYL